MELCMDLNGTVSFQDSWFIINFVNKLTTEDMNEIKISFVLKKKCFHRAGNCVRWNVITSKISLRRLSTKFETILLCLVNFPLSLSIRNLGLARHIVPHIFHIQHYPFTQTLSSRTLKGRFQKRL